MKIRILLLGVLLVGIFFALPWIADAATLQLSPSSGSYNSGQTFSVELRVNSDGVAINAAESTIRFPQNLVQIESISSAGIFTFWPVSPTFSNATGIMSFSGGLPNPGYTGSAGKILTIMFRSIAAGSIQIRTENSRVLANDGQGTDVMTTEGTIGTFAVSEDPVVLPDAPTVSSPSHPDPNQWYNNPNPIFSWDPVSGATGYSVAYDDQPATTPDTTVDVIGTTQAYTAIGDGTWYFHIRAENVDGWGTTAHFRTQIDLTAPEPFSIEFLDGTSLTNTTLRLSFMTTDNGSGMAYYGVVIDGGDPIRVEVGSADSFSYSSLSFGSHSVIVRAIDAAGNAATASGSFTMTRPNPPVYIPNDSDRPDQIIIDTIDEILPTPIRNFSSAVSNVVNRIQQNEEVVRIIEEIITPVISTTAVVTATGVATSVAALQLGNVIYLFLRVGYLWFVPVAVGKRRKPWGIVFDSTTNQPVRRSIVRIFSKEFNKLKETQITDGEGRFGFLIEPGKYFVTASHPGYTFPSKLLRSASVTPFENIYLGDTLEMKTAGQQVLAINVPIDPDQGEIPRSRILWLRAFNTIGNILERASLPLLIVGTISSWASLIIQPITNNYLFLMVYGLLIILKYLVSHHYEKSWGTVVDAATNAPIELGVVRIYNMMTTSVVGTRVTNTTGQFQALVAPGKYYLVVVKSGYESFQSKPIIVTRERGMIRLTVKLRKHAAPGEQRAAGDKAVELDSMRSDEQAPFAPPPLQDVRSGETQVEESAATAPASDSPFAPPTLRVVPTKKDSFSHSEPSGKPEKK
ncbi:MAG: carboxypeptidase regulatory-like domain-containing protein [Candidatus Kerfeldbacteria bacterium]|nr:carboxypeptidase regulatory-like domain-containing protein [Candidatus Kerfeldbacteria bacterium]